MAHTLWSVPFNKDAEADQWGASFQEMLWDDDIECPHAQQCTPKCFAHTVQRSASAISTAHLRVRAGTWKIPDRR